MALLNKAQALSRREPAREGSELYVSGIVVIPVHRCLRCGYEWLAFGFKPAGRPCTSCGDPRWTEPRENRPQKGRKSVHDKRTLETR